MVEIMVVLAVSAAIAAAAIPALGRDSGMRSGPSSLSVSAGAQSVWHGIMAYRSENQGLFPTSQQILPAAGSDYGSGMVIRGTTTRYIPTWPTDSNGNRVQISVMPADASGAPATRPQTEDSNSSAATTLVYSTSSDRLTGWLAAYNSAGKLVFRRSVDPGASAGEPIG